MADSSSRETPVLNEGKGEPGDASGTRRASGAAAEQGEWSGTHRYHVVRTVGQGGMGIVYEAIDRERGQAVALKRLLHFGPAALYRFKQEFRALAHVLHPNLVRLHELVVTEEAGACFAMELVRGVDFLEHVRPADDGATKAADEASDAQTPRPRSALGASPAADATAAGRQLPADLDKLRPALRQLVEGLLALHAAGKLHRDIKPSNVLVAEDGRVVILDFGVSTELTQRRGRSDAEQDEIVGTARYMAPEQALGEPPVAASDWYSVGVVLYEALVGRAPFVGSELDVIQMKVQLAPTPASECVDGVPPDLDSLCQALLDPEPERRPTGPEILRRLGVTRSARPVPSLLPLKEGTSLVGREAQLRSLRDAFEAARSGHSVTVEVAGASGMGKSAVAQHFLDGLAEAGEAAILRGRAYERETVPYKAFDGVIDALSRYLIQLEGKPDPVVSQISIAADRSWNRGPFRATRSDVRSSDRDGVTARLPPPLLNTRSVKTPSVSTCALQLCPRTAVAQGHPRPPAPTLLDPRAAPSSRRSCGLDGRLLLPQPARKCAGNQYFAHRLKESRGTVGAGNGPADAAYRDKVGLRAQGQRHGRRDRLPSRHTPAHGAWPRS